MGADQTARTCAAELVCAFVSRRLHKDDMSTVIVKLILALKRKKYFIFVTNIFLPTPFILPSRHLISFCVTRLGYTEHPKNANTFRAIS